MGVITSTSSPFAANFRYDVLALAVTSTVPPVNGTFTLPGPFTYDVNFNEEVIGSHGEFFSTPEELGALVESVEADPVKALQRGEELRESIERYNWDDVADRYASLCQRLAARDFPSRRPSGRRVGAGREALSRGPAGAPTGSRTAG